MPYQQDLTLYNYWPQPYGPILAVGWLEYPNPYPKGPVPIAFLNQLMKWFSNEDNIIMFTRGFHECNLKETTEDVKEWYKTTELLFDGNYLWGNGEIHIKYQGKYYASPVMIFEYIHKYAYQPPNEYIEAVMKGEIICQEIYEQQEIANSEVDIIGTIKKLTNDKFYKKALALLEEHQNRLGNNPSIYAYRGYLYFELGNLIAAKSDLEMVLPPMRLAENKRNAVETLYILGRIAFQEKEYKKARYYLSEAIIFEPNDKYIRQLLKKTKIKCYWIDFISFIGLEK